MQKGGACLKLRKFVPILLALSLLSGCAAKSGGHTPTGNALVMEDDSTIAAQPTEQTTADTVTMTYHPDLTMNPLACTDAANRALFSLLYQGLFSVDRTYRVEPLLCDRYTVSPDNTVYTFYVTQATFSDGSAVTAADVAATLQAARESDYYGGRFSHVSDISQNGDGVTVTLDTPYENLPLLLDVPILKAGQADSTRPIGTGPYTLEESGTGGLLRRRSGWWCKAALPLDVPTVTLQTAGAASEVRDQFEFGGVDLVCATPASDSYASFRCDYELWDCENGMFLYLATNQESEVFSDATVRSALPFAIDRETLAGSYYHGFAQAASLPASPQSPYYSDALAAKYTYDSAKFARAVTAAGKKGASVVLLVNKDDGLRVRVARDIRQMLQNGGLTVELKALSTTQYKEALLYRTYDLYLGQTKLSPNMDLSPFFENWGNLNYGGMDDAALYSACLESLANSGNYYTLHQAVMDDGRLCPILFCNYAVYATRGLLNQLSPARDNLFYYSTGRSLAEALTVDTPEDSAVSTEPEN